jgi:hypothetical protein
MSQAEQANKAVVRRLVAEVFNGGRLAAINELYAPELAPAARRWIAPFRASFPDVHMEIVELIAEGDTVVGRFTCSATHRGSGLVTLQPAAASSGSTRSLSSGLATAGSPAPGRWRTPYPAFGSWGSPTPEPRRPALTDDELRHLRRCVEMATEALEAGDEPFRSVLVAANLAPAERAAATVFTSGEHCPMCAAAYGWVGLAHRHVSSSEQLAAWVADLGVPRHRCGPSPSRRLSPSPGRWANPRPRRSGPRPHPPLPWRILIGDVPGPPHRRHHHPRAGLATRPAQPDRVGPIVAAIVLCPGPTRAAAGATPPSPCWVALRRSPPPPARRYGCG